MAVTTLCGGCAADEPSSAYGVAQATDEADFRNEVRSLMHVLENPCPLTEDNALLSLYDPAKSRLGELEARLEGTVGAIDYAIARADYPLTLPIYECASPDTSGTEERIERDVLNAMEIIERLETSFDQSPMNQGEQ